MPTAVWSHNTLVSKATNFTPFQLMYRAEAIVPEQIKHISLHRGVEVPACPREAEDKNLLEPDRLKAVANFYKYQEETRAWTDPKVKLCELDVGDLVL
jgi:hypothetical protein